MGVERLLLEGGGTMWGRGGWKCMCRSREVA